MYLISKGKGKGRKGVKTERDLYLVDEGKVEEMDVKRRGREGGEEREGNTNLDHCRGEKKNGRGIKERAEKKRWN